MVLYAEYNRVAKIGHDGNRSELYLGYTFASPAMCIRGLDSSYEREVRGAKLIAPGRTIERMFLAGRFYIDRGM